MSHLDKLKELRKSRRKAKLANKKELHKEYEGKKKHAKEIEALEKQQERAQDQLEQLEMESNGVDYTRVKNLNYSIEEDEEWNKKTKRNLKKQDREFQNYKQMAERTYVKDIEAFDKLSSEEYSEEKKKYRQLLDEGLTEEQAIVQLSDKNKLKRHLENIEAKERKTYKKRSKVTAGGINDKNRQFNEKLDREYH